MLDIADPYLGDTVGEYSDWTPLEQRGWLFEEDLDRSDPWQFKNFRVASGAWHGWIRSCCPVQPGRPA